MFHAEQQAMCSKWNDVRPQNRAGENAGIPGMAYSYQTPAGERKQKPWNLTAQGLRQMFHVKHAGNRLFDSSIRGFRAS